MKGNYISIWYNRSRQGDYMKTTLYIVNHSYKEKMLKENKFLDNKKYMSLEDFKKSYLFDYDEEAIYYLMKSRNIKYDIAKNYIDNMYFLWNTKDIEEQKVIELKDLYYELKEQGLLKQNYLFREYLKQVNIVVKGYLLSKYDQKMFDSIKQITSVEIELPTRENNIPNVYAFDTIEEEVIFVAISIIEKLKETDISNIKVAFTNEYEYIVRNIFKMFNLPINIKGSSILYGNSVCKQWITTLIETKDIEETSKILIDRYGYIEPIKKLIDITNTLPGEEVNYTYLDYFVSKCKMTKLKIEKIIGIECISLLDSDVEDSKYIYLLGCNAENMPRIYKDEEYLSDSTREELGLDTSFDRNKLEKEKWDRKIYNTKNLTITYKFKTPFQSYTKSPILKDFSTNEVERNNYLYSNLYNRLSLAKKIDKLIKYGEHDNDLSILYNNYKNIEYRKYDNKFTCVSEDEIKSFLQNKVHLSYSSMNNYYLCAFRYYIANLLKLDIYEETFMTEIGNLYHYVLSKSVEDNFNFEHEYEGYISGKEWSNKEKFFIEKLRGELEFVINTLEYQNRFTTLKQTLCEEKMYANPTTNTIFSGIIDKIMYKEDNKQKLVSIVDYKTGTPQTNIMNIPYGLEMQLPVYVYLLKNNPKFRESKIVGFYLQKILNKDFSYDGDDYDREKRRLLRLDGYSINDESLLEQFDCTYKDSEFIRGMKIGKNGFYSYAKVIKEEEIDEMCKQVEQKIIEASDNILSGNFPINPKRIDDELVGCKYCKFKDICYKTEKDVVNLEKINSLNFLGGE